MHNSSNVRIVFQIKSFVDINVAWRSSLKKAVLYIMCQPTGFSNFDQGFYIGIFIEVVIEVEIFMDPTH